MKKKILSVFLTLAMILSMVTAFAGTVSATEADLEIADYSDLEAFIASLATESYAGKLVVVTDDIIVNDGWVANDGENAAVAAPTGEFAETLDTTAATVAFAGTFDGGNHTISGLYMTGCAFFPTVNGATIQNVTFANCASKPVSKIAGIVAGTHTGGSLTISNVVVEDSKIYNGTANISMGTILATTASSGAVSFTDCKAIDCDLFSGAGTSLVGGLVGAVAASGTTFLRCYNSTEIFAMPAANGNKNAGYKIGGIIGNNSADTTTVTDCVNAGNITSFTIAGGIVGDTSKAIVINHCVNYGDMTASASPKEDGTGYDCYAAGIMGRNNNGGGCQVNNSANFGTIASTNSCAASKKKVSYSGGIVSSITMKRDRKTVEVNGFLNQGEIIARSDEYYGYAGGAFGYINSTTVTSGEINSEHVNIKNFVNTADVTAEYKAGGLVGFFNGLQGKIEKAITIGTVIGYNDTTSINTGASCAIFGQWIQQNGDKELEVTDFFYSNNGNKNVFGLWANQGTLYDNHKVTYTATEQFLDFVPGETNAGDGAQSKNLGIYNQFFADNGYKADASEFYAEKGANIFKAFNLGVDWMLTDTVPVPASVFAFMEESEIVEGAVDYAGYQASAGAELTSIRVVAGLNSTTYTNTGFEIYLVANGQSALMLDKSTTTVYTALNVYDAEGNALDPYLASEAGYTYLSAITLNFDDLSVLGDATTLIVKPYVTVNGEKIYGSSCAIVVEKTNNVLSIANQYVM